MPQPPSFFSEAQAAWQGFLKLMANNRTAAEHFTFTPSGLAGGAIAYLTVNALVALTLLFGANYMPGMISTFVLIMVVSAGLEIALTAIVLKQINHFDGLMPYLVSSAWCAAFLQAAVIALNVVGFNGIFIQFCIACFLLWARISVVRNIVRLSGAHTALLIMVQVLVSGSIMLLLIVLLAQSGIVVALQ